MAVDVRNNFYMYDHEVLNAAIEKYEAAIMANASKMDARFVIDKRTRFGGMFSEIVRRDLLAKGIHPANTLANLL